MMSAGQVSDIEMAKPVVGMVGHSAQLIADKGYDSDDFRAFLREQQINPVIPARSNRENPEPWYLYAARHAIENLFSKLKQFRAVATRYDKTITSFSAMVLLACIVIWARI